MTEGFFRRWSRVKAESKPEAAPPAQPAVAEPGVDSERSVVPAQEREQGRALPTMQDVSRLTADSDYSAFVAKGVDSAVRRQALKKLFSQPHFNIMDGLDIYIDDYNRASPLPASMLAMLQQAQGFLATDKQNQSPDADMVQGEAEQIQPSGDDAPQQGEQPPTKGKA